MGLTVEVAMFRTGCAANAIAALVISAQSQLKELTRCVY